MSIYQSASTYTGIEATPLAKHDYSDIILSNVYGRDWVSQVTSNELLEPVHQLPTLRELNNMMQMHQITPEQHRELLKQIRSGV